MTQNQNQNQTPQATGTDVTFGLFQLICYTISIIAGIVAVSNL